MKNVWQINNRKNVGIFLNNSFLCNKIDDKYYFQNYYSNIIVINEVWKVRKPKPFSYWHLKSLWYNENGSRKESTRENMYNAILKAVVEGGRNEK